MKTVEMMKQCAVKFFCLTLILVLTTIFSDHALADTAIGFGVDSSVVMLRIDPGNDMPFSFSVINNTGFEQIVHLEQKDIVLGDENEVIFLDTKDGASSWVTFGKNDFALANGQSQIVDAVVKIPEGQENGAKMMTMVSFSQSGNVSQIGPQVAGGIGVYVILSGKDSHDGAGEIGNFINTKFIRDSVDVHVEYSNIGDVQFVPQTEVSVENIFTRERIGNSFDSHFVFPGKKFTFTKNISKLSPLGVYALKVSFKDGNGKFIEKTSYAMGKFFPIPFLAVVMISGYLSVVLFRVRRKNSNKSY